MPNNVVSTIATHVLPKMDKPMDWSVTFVKEDVDDEDDDDLLQ